MDRLVEMLMVEETIDGDLFRNIVEENKFDKIPVTL
jgi:cell division protease FtsH